MTKKVSIPAVLLARMAKGASQGEAAKRMKMTPSYLSKIESGRVVKPSPKTRAALRDYYRIPVERLLKSVTVEF